MNYKNVNKMFYKNINNHNHNYIHYKMIYNIQKKKYQKLNKKIRYQHNNNKMNYQSLMKKC